MGTGASGNGNGNGSNGNGDRLSVRFDHDDLRLFYWMAKEKYFGSTAGTLLMAIEHPEIYEIILEEYKKVPADKDIGEPKDAADPDSDRKTFRFTDDSGRTMLEWMVNKRYAENLSALVRLAVHHPEVYSPILAAYKESMASSPPSAL